MFKNMIVLIVILVNALIVNYTIKLEHIDCECSKSWHRDFIKYYSLITIIMTVLILFNLSSIIKKSVWKFIHNIYYIIGLCNIYILFKYSQDLYINKCECSKSWEQKFIYYYSMSFMLLYIILICGMLFTSLFNNRLV